MHTPAELSRDQWYFQELYRWSHCVLYVSLYAYRVFFTVCNYIQPVSPLHFWKRTVFVFDVHGKNVVEPGNLFANKGLNTNWCHWSVVPSIQRQDEEKCVLLLFFEERAVLILIRLQTRFTMKMRLLLSFQQKWYDSWYTSTERVKSVEQVKYKKSTNIYRSSTCLLVQFSFRICISLIALYSLYTINSSITS